MIQSPNDPRTRDSRTDVYAVILAGGSGTRFWPLSRETHPKQMLQIVGEDSLLRETIKRIHGFVPGKNIWIVTTEEKAQDIRFHIDSLGSLAKEIQFINEPLGRNTAPAVGLAALYLNQISPASIMVVLPSDHAIPDPEKFLRDLKLAVQGAEKDSLVTFGIKPIRPETGYGYIKVRPTSKMKSRGLLKVERFFEKPDLKTAKRYLSHGGYFWNSGIFVFKASKILSELQKFIPSLHKKLLSIPPSAIPARPAGRGHAPWSEQYATLEPISIDYAIMERSRDLLMVPAKFRWSDLGSWAALDEVIEKDKTGNILRGNTINIGSQNSTVFAGDRLVATIGLKDMVVVDTPDATLVTPKERVQEVRKIVETLKQGDREEHLIHKTVERPWGSYTVLEKGDRYKIKRVVLKPKAKLSLQLHRKRSEHWVVVSGVAKVTREEETYLAYTNESTYIPVNTKHRLENPEEVPLQIIEVQNGEYLEEDDIVRFADDYGRQ
ncbi:MAG: mannose-1-phosphate guanylyltransferase/mannose-6-phosphate isomerase [Deltaproteobacteria bacterium RBG_16_48_10]|nr:MAG: mannose-1-phosphate guanylyltransferase/mannose-6-phosphate isomerase [Deltaproteobacteria bacterium RBG_16_48_10]